MSADPLLDGPLDPIRDAFEANPATSRCSYSTSLAIWSGARYGEAMHTLGRRLECGTGTDRVALPEQKGRGDGAFASPDLDEFLEVEGVGYSIPLSANRDLEENKRLGRDGMDANKTVNAHRLVVIIEGAKSDWNELTSLSRHGCLWRNASSNYGDR